MLPGGMFKSVFVACCTDLFNDNVIFEPCCEKTGLQGFRPGLTQTGMYNNRRWLEA